MKKTMIVAMVILAATLSVGQSQEGRWTLKSFSTETEIAVVEHNGNTYVGACKYTSFLSSPDYVVPAGGDSQINDDPIGGFRSKTTRYEKCALTSLELGRYKSCSTNANHKDAAACVAHGENPKGWFAFDFHYKPSASKPNLYSILVAFDLEEQK
jgi:hypothetical protein